MDKLKISHQQIIVSDWINDYTFGICPMTDDCCRYNSNCHQRIIYALYYIYTNSIYPRVPSYIQV